MYVPIGGPYGMENKRRHISTQNKELLKSEQIKEKPASL
jgi:hypothetical protein